ncbi:MAG TPA: hypothetical protein VIQ03_10295 [Gammaproteobacteria bacterium]
MGVLSVQTSAVQGIQRGLDGMRKNAAEIASADQLNQAGNETDLAGAMVEMNQNKVQVQASAKVVSALDEMVGTLIDTRA